MRRHIYTLATLVAALLCLPVFGAATPPASGPRLSIATESDQTVFHIGERIPIVLSFTGPDDESFAIDLAGYDRSGRLSEDTYNIEPHTGWRDPLVTYLHHGSYMGGGIRGTGSLSSKPQIIHANLNEWVRFDQSGNYTLTVTSQRVGQSRKDENASRLPREPLRLLSANSLELTIIPATPAWQQQTIRRILRNLPHGSKL